MPNNHRSNLLFGNFFSFCTADINEAEMKWKEEFHQWSTKYMVDWKAEFDNYIYNKDQECSRPNT